MHKKISFIIFIFIVIVPLTIEQSSLADEKSIKDCLESNDDCLEELEQPVKNIDEEQGLSADNVKSTSVIFNFIKMIFALLLVLALIYLLLTFVKKRNRLFQQSSILENLGGISVGQNKSIQLVRIGDKVYIIGVGDNVEMLQELTDHHLKQQLLEKNTETNELTSILPNLFKKGTTKQADQKANVQEKFTLTLEEELNKLKKHRNQMMNQFKKKDNDKYV